MILSRYRTHFSSQLRSIGQRPVEVLLTRCTSLFARHAVSSLRSKVVILPVDGYSGVPPSCPDLDKHGILMSPSYLGDVFLVLSRRLASVFRLDSLMVSDMVVIFTLDLAFFWHRSAGSLFARVLSSVACAFFLVGGGRLITAGWRFLGAVPCKVACLMGDFLVSAYLSFSFLRSSAPYAVLW